MLLKHLGPCIDLCRLGGALAALLTSTFWMTSNGGFGVCVVGMDTCSLQGGLHIYLHHY